MIDKLKEKEKRLKLKRTENPQYCVSVLEANAVLRRSDGCLQKWKN